MSAAVNQRLHVAAQALAGAGRGERDAIIAACCADLSISRPTFYRKIKSVMAFNQRKRRADAGDTALTLDEAKLVSAYVREHVRRNDKRLATIERALEVLRANGKVVAARIDEETGEIRFLTPGAVAQALRKYRLHPDQLAQPKAAVRLASKHPNHVWQLDASICVLFYLPNAEKGRRLSAMPAAEFNDNKPNNLKKIENDRVWRYVITDHASGWIFCRYVFGGETAQNVVDVLIQAMIQREGDPVHGVPHLLMVDPGSANTSAALKNLCHSLGIRLIVNQVGNPRAKGQVENAQNLVETIVESGLTLHEVRNLDELNAVADMKLRYVNSAHVHSRHQKTRWSAWCLIHSSQLIIAPPADVCRAVAHSAPEKRRVSAFLDISFGGQTWDVSSVPFVMVDETLQVCRNPWRDDVVQVVTVGEDGREQFHLAPLKSRDERWGFYAGSAIIGDDFKRHADTPAERHAKDLEMLVTGTETLDDAAKVRKGKRTAVLQSGALAGIDPFITARNTRLPTYLPKAGTALEGLPGGLVIEPVRESVIDVLMRLKRALGAAYDPSIRAFLQNKYPDGLTSEDADRVVAQALDGLKTARKEAVL